MEKRDKIYLKIVTPERIFFEEEVKKIIYRAESGEMAILKDHSPIMSKAGIGLLRIYKDDDTIIYAALMGGVVFFKDNELTILTDDISLPEEIDKKRAEEALNRANERIKMNKHDIDSLRAENALRKALVRIDVANLTEKFSKKRKEK